MEAIRKPAFKLLYNSRDITEDISKYLLSVTYVDKIKGESDELDISVEDVNGLWRNTWYPKKGDVLKFSIGFNDSALVDCGTFEIDEITLSGPPDIATIKSLAAGVSKAVRTKLRKSFESQSLRQIAQYIADKHGFKLTGNIGNVNFERVTQNKETDLSFLHRIATDYGYLFSIRDKQLIFTSVFEIENGSAVTEINRTDLRSYSITDKTSETYKEANVKYHDPNSKKVNQAKVTTLQNKDNVTYKQIESADSLEIRTKAESPAQAEQKATAALHYKNSLQQKGTVQLEGNPILVAGNNFTLAGLGTLSGKFNIEKSTHKIMKSGGYTLDLDIKRISPATDSQKGGNKKAGSDKFKVVDLTNKDKITFKQIEKVQ